MYLLKSNKIICRSWKSQHSILFFGWLWIC